MIDLTFTCDFSVKKDYRIGATLAVRAAVSLALHMFALVRSWRCCYGNDLTLRPPHLFGKYVDNVSNRERLILGERVNNFTLKLVRMAFTV